MKARSVPAYYAIALFILTVPAANWMISHIGACGAAGPCVVPVLPGISAPSGVFMAGAAFVLRDWVHEEAGWGGAWACIVIGAAVSLAVAPAALAWASMAAFLTSETADMIVYTWAKERSGGRVEVPVLLSGAVGAVVDSAAFLFIAFGSLQYLGGQIVGKMWVVGLAAVAIAACRVLLRRAY